MTEEEKIKYAMYMSRVGLLASGAIRQSCVASAKITTEVLRSLDIYARPMTASVLVATGGWFTRAEKEGRFPRRDEADQWWEEDRAYSLGVAYDPEPSEGAFSGHMIVLAGEGARYLVDPSLDQLSRPQRDLPLDPVYLDLTAMDHPAFDQRQFRLGKIQAITGWTHDNDPAKEMIVVWSCFPGDRTFRQLPDFTMFRVRYGEMTDSIVETIKDMEAAGMTGDTLPPLPAIPEAPDAPHLVARARTPEELQRIRMSAS